MACETVKLIAWRFLPDWHTLSSCAWRTAFSLMTKRPSTPCMTSSIDFSSSGFLRDQFYRSEEENAHYLTIEISHAILQQQKTFFSLFSSIFLYISLSLFLALCLSVSISVSLCLASSLSSSLSFSISLFPSVSISISRSLCPSLPLSNSFSGRF